MFLLRNIRHTQFFSNIYAIIVSTEWVYLLTRQDRSADGKRRLRCDPRKIKMHMHRWDAFLKLLHTQIRRDDSLRKYGSNAIESEEKDRVKVEESKKEKKLFKLAEGWSAYLISHFQFPVHSFSFWHLLLFFCPTPFLYLKCTRNTYASYRIGKNRQVVTI